MAVRTSWTTTFEAATSSWVCLDSLRMNRPNTTAATIITGNVPSIQSVSSTEKYARATMPPTIKMSPRNNSANVTVKMSWMVAMSALMRLFRSPTRRAS